MSTSFIVDGKFVARSRLGCSPAAGCNTRRMRRASWRRAAASDFLRVCALHARAKCFKLPHRALTLRAIFPIRDRLAGVWKCALQAVAGLGPRRPSALLDADGAQRAGSPPASERIV